MTTQARMELTAVDKTRAAFDSANRGLESIGERITRLGIGLDGVGTSIAGLFSLATIGSMVALAKSAADFADEMGKAAQRAGTAVEEFSALAYAAKLADVSQEDLGKALKTLSVEIEGGGKELKAYGINATTADQALLQLADRIAATEDPTKRVAIAAKVLGERFGPQMVPLLAQGSRGLKDAMEEARRFGVVVNAEASAAAEKFNDNLTRLGTLAQGLKISLTNDLVQGLGNATEAFLKANREGGKFAALVAGIQTFLTGDDRHKANVSMVENAARIMEIQNAQDRIRKAAGDRAAAGTTWEENLTGQEAKTLGNLQAELAQRQAAFRTAQGYAKQLDDAAAGTGSRGGGGGRGKPPQEPPYRDWMGRRLDWLTPIEVEAAEDAGQRQEAQANINDTARRFLQDSDEMSAGLAELREQARARQKAELQLQEEIMRLSGRTTDDRKRQLTGSLEAMLDKDPSAFTAEELDKIVKGIGNIGDALKDTRDIGDDFGRSFSTALDGILFRTRSIGETFRALGVNILSTAVQQGFTEPIGTSLGKSLKSLLGFEGGGFTGYGPRTGGMDGRGGFLAMLHPNETVVDHTRGGATGKAPITINLNVNQAVGDVATVSMLRESNKHLANAIFNKLERANIYG
jgi:hypothetical protein